MSSVKQPVLGVIASALITAGFSASATAGPIQQQQPVDGPKVIRKSGGVLQASATKRVEPAYPPLAKAAQVSGAVVVEITIDESGNVISARVLSGHPLLKDAAILAARQWKFEPTTLQGVPVKVIGTITFNFQMGAGEELSIEAAEKAVQEHPDSGRAHYDLALAYGRSTRRPDAIQSLREAIRVDGQFELAYRDLGLYLAKPETMSEAIDMLKEAIRLNSHDTDARSMLIAIYLDSKRNEDAANLLKEWINVSPSNAEPFVRLAAVDVAMEKYDEAEEALKQGLQVEPTRTEASVALGELYTREGRTADAIDILKPKAVSLGWDAGFALTNIARAHFALGMAYLKSGDKNSAMDEYNVLKPKFPALADELLKEINK